MSLTFKCPACGEEITVAFLKVGEEAHCTSCGARSVVPPIAAETDKTPGYTTSPAAVPGLSPSTGVGGVYEQSLTAQPAWDPKVLAWLVFFFSYLPAGIVWALNWERLGKPERKTKALAAILISFPVFIAVIMLTANTVIGRLLGIVNTAVAMHLYRSQKLYYAAFLEAGGRKAGYALPVLNSVGFVVVILLVTVGYNYVNGRKLEARWLEADAYITQGQTEQAREILLELQRDYPDEPGVPYLFGALYLGEGFIDSSYACLERAHSMEPDALDIKSQMTWMIEEAGWIPEGYGKVTTWYETGEVYAVREYCEGQWDGITREYYPTGTLKYQVEYAEGQEHGPVEYYYENGQKMGAGTYVHGKRHGEFKMWDQEGDLESLEVYANGEQVD